MTKTERIRQLEEKVKALELRIALMEASKQPTYVPLPVPYFPHVPVPWAPPLQPNYPYWTASGKTTTQTLPDMTVLYS